ncbi:hypothetical protein BDR07DRAFT_1381921 [Suillus spraguei]|nr:hypothetical protein BDR07DRAFT_1381921 [Suillus spraguei]
MPTQPGLPPPPPVGDTSSQPRLCAVPGYCETCVVASIVLPSPAKAGPSAVHSAPAPSPTISLNMQVPTSSAVAHTPSQLPTSSGATYTPSQVPTPAIAHASSEGRSYPSNKGKDRALPPSEVDIHANPCYPLQLPPAFTQRYAEQEQQLKATAHQAAEQHNLEHRMKNTVEVYGWSKDSAEVTMCEFQEDITLPQFKVTAQVLRVLGLWSGNDTEAQVQYFNVSRSRWSTVQQGHALMLDSRQVYMRTLGVTIIPEFDNIFESNSLHVVPNIRTNLKAEHAAIRLSNTRTQLRAASITASDSEDPEDMRKRHSPEDAVDVDAFDDVRCWPASFYVCEIADGFKKYDKSCKGVYTSVPQHSQSIGNDGTEHWHLQEPRLYEQARVMQACIQHS